MSFADSFWTQDYHLGFKILFDQLHEGVNENEDFIQLFTKRMELEIIYGTQLESIEKSLKSSSKRQNNDDYVSSIKNAYQKINENFNKQAGYHLQIGSNIQLLVLDPFSKWCKEHKQRIEYSESVLFDKYKAFKNSKTNLEKLQKRYFNRCRMLEEFKSHYTEDEINEELKDLEFADNIEAKEEENEADGTVYDLGCTKYDNKSVKALLTTILKNIELTSHKVPILGTYNNVSSGSAITQWLLDNMEELNRNIAKAETFGQDLVNNGFIRLIGSMSGGKNFINSSQFFYQWKPIVFEITKISELESVISEADSSLSRTSSTAAKGSQFADYFEDMKQAMGVTSIDYKDKSQLSKLVVDVNALDDQYYKSTVNLDKTRCELEEIIMDHLTFMQKCELDRLKAIKKVTFDFIASFANKVNTMKQICDELLVLEETIHPMSDLKFLIENYATGKFKPQVVLYDNYYNSNIKQTFGVDLTVKSRLDRKVVPLIIQCILSHLDKVYPDLVNDQERINLWTMPIHLTQVHQLRFQLNDTNDTSKINEILSGTHPMIITNVFKLYFMELPDSVIPHDYYDLIKSLYQNYPVNSDDFTVNESRINGLQNLLVDLPKCSLATLDAILTHLSRLIHIIGSKNEELSKSLQLKLSKEFANLILRPKLDLLSFDGSNNSSSYINDKHQYTFMNDLFEYKDTIFKELRRRNSSRSNNPTRESSTKTTRSTLSTQDNTKSRLESKLQKAVHNSKKQAANESNLKSSLSKDADSGPKSNKYDNMGSSILSSERPEPPSTPPPSTPKKSAPTSLKRSTSPNKKKLNTYLKDSNGDNSSSSAPKSIVSSKPSKKDIVINKDYNSSSNESPSGSYSDLTQPRFVQGLERKTSVKDMASKFDSPTPPPELPAKDSDKRKKQGRSEKENRDNNDEGVIIVD